MSGRGEAGRRWRGKGRQTYYGSDAGYPLAPAESQTAHASKDNSVNTFNGKDKFLSNFSWSDLDFEGERYPSVEHAFQAAKLRTNAERRSYGFFKEGLSFGDAKRLGRSVPLREDWKQIREDVMSRCLIAKFEDPSLRAKLLTTGEGLLLDGHSGSPDLIWGYHFPSQAGENRLGILMMELRSQIRAEIAMTGPKKTDDVVTLQEAVHHASLFHLDWPMKCLNDGLPLAYSEHITKLARSNGLSGCLTVLPRQKICIALCGTRSALGAWEHLLRTQMVDVNSKGRPCRERMLVELLSGVPSKPPPVDAIFQRVDVASWAALQQELARATGLAGMEVDNALGPEPPKLPQTVQYANNRSAVILDGKRFALCLNDNDALVHAEALLGNPENQEYCGTGEVVHLQPGGNGKPSIFGGRFARIADGLLHASECQQLMEVTEKAGYGLAGSRGFNPYARYALRCLVDASAVAAAITKRLAHLLPAEYPPGSGRPLVGVNERLRFLKYLPGMHHAGDHTDCAHEDPRGRSFLTVQLYLNDTFKGGRTTFISENLVPIEPAPGRAIIFDHELYHRGERVAEGVKYAIRMDVLYGHPGTFADTSEKVVTQVQHEAKQNRRGRWTRQ